VLEKNSTRIGPGNQYIKTKLCHCALAASRTKNTYLAAKYFSIKGRRGTKKAVIATARHMIVSAFFIIRDKEYYKELGGDYLTKLKSNNIVKSMTGRLKSLGYEVVKVVQQYTSTCPSIFQIGNSCFYLSIVFLSF
jgi:hypothetical protein